MSLDPVHASTDPPRQALPSPTHPTHPTHPSRSAAGPGTAGRPSRADHGLCRESRRAPHPAAGHRGRLAPEDACPAEPDPDGPYPVSGLMLEDIEARLAAAPRDDISGLRWIMGLYQHLLDRASTVEDLEVAERALNAISNAVDGLGRSPFIYRKAGQSPFLRELVISFGATGYVALIEILDEQEVVIAAVRHQREDDYY